MKVYWHKCGPGLGNLGDRLTPLLLDYFNVPVQWAPPEKAQLFGIGSVLQRVPPGFTGLVWSSGLLEPTSQPNLSQARVLGLRGRLTENNTLLPPSDNPIVHGDGGLLCHLFQRPARRRFKLGLIPHYADTCPPLHSLPNNGHDMRLIDICDDLPNVIQAISECDGILSSSLHGLVLADALRVPNHWITFDSNRVLGNGFKFRDHYSCFGLDQIAPAPFNASSNLDTLLPLLEGYERPGLETLQRELLDTLTTVASEHGAPHWQLGQLPIQEREEQVRARVPSAIVNLDQSTPAASPLLAETETITRDPQVLGGFLLNCIDLLIGLRDSGVSHRDIRTETLFVRDNKPRLGHFGWAIMEQPPLSPALAARDLKAMLAVFTELNGSAFPWYDTLIQLMGESTDQPLETWPHLIEAAITLATEPPTNLRPAKDPHAAGIALLQSLRRSNEENARLTRELEEARRELWDAELGLIIGELAGLIPAGEPFALVDENQCARMLPPQLFALPFPEQNQVYGGVPHNDADAIHHLERTRASGVRYLAFIQSTFWWLDHYTALRAHLTTCAETLLRNEHVHVFKLKPRPVAWLEAGSGLSSQPNRRA